MAKTRFASPPAVRAVRAGLAALLACLVVLLGGGGLAHADARTSFLIDRLKADDFRVRTSAALQLGATGDDAAVGPLCGALGDGNDVVRQAAGAGLARLGKAQAVGCVQQHLQSEQNASVKAQLEKTLATLQPAGGGGGGGGGGDDSSPPEVSGAKFYISISPVANASDRAQGEVDQVIRASIKSKLGSLGDYQLAPGKESPDAARAVIARRHLKGYYLSVQLEKFDYSGGNLRVRVKIAVFSYPSKSLAGEIPAGLTQTGVSPGSHDAEDGLMQMAAEQATQLFAQNFH
jgi:hypothetical protein